MGLYSIKPNLGPGGWWSHSYFSEEIRDRSKYAAYAKASAGAIDVVFAHLIEAGVVVSNINVWWSRDRDENPRCRDNYYLFFENYADASLFGTHLAEIPIEAFSGGERLFFNFFNHTLGDKISIG